MPVEIDALFDEMVDTRRALHRRPELGFEEFETTALIKERLTGIGLEERPLSLTTGAVFRLAGGRPGRPVVLRADIDGLPVQEESGLPFASAIEGRMHACGHDAHVASLLGVAGALARRADDLPGSYTFLFQPAEELLGGASAMVEAGVLEGLDGAVVIGHHVSSAMPSGMVGLRPGTTMSEVHSIALKITGPGGHAAMLGRKGDVVASLGEAITRLESVVDGLSYENVGCVCSAGLASAGSAPNVVPVSALLRGTLRTFTSEQREEALGRLEALCGRLAEERGVEVEFAVLGRAPAVVNDAAVTAVVQQVAGTRLGDRVVTIPPVTPSDDVSEFMNRLPGCYFFVGGGRPDASSGAHHSPTFSIDEACLRVSAGVMADAAVALAGGEPPPG